MSCGAPVWLKEFITGMKELHFGRTIDCFFRIETHLITVSELSCTLELTRGLLLVRALSSTKASTGFRVTI